MSLLKQMVMAEEFIADESLSTDSPSAVQSTSEIFLGTLGFLRPASSMQKEVVRSHASTHNLVCI